MKHIGKGILAGVFFYIFNLFIMGIIGQYIFTGDSFTLSFHLFTYTGLIVLCGIVIACTCTILGKLDEIKTMLKAFDENKQDT